MVGPAGSGKTSIASQLLQRFGDTLSRSVSVTTRAMRAGEVHGKSYHFVSEEEFSALKADNKLFECEKTHGFWYGTLSETLETAKTQGRDLIFDIDIRGALTLKNAYPANTCIVFLLAPGEKALVDRIKGRGKVSSEELDARLKTAKEEYEKLLQYQGKNDIDYLLVNEDFETSVKVVSSIIEAERARFSRMASPYLTSLCKL